jgi:hypothetical protein
VCIANLHREWGELQGNYDELRFFTGLRPSEEITLLVSDYDAEDGVLQDFASQADRAIRTHPLPKVHSSVDQSVLLDGGRAFHNFARVERISAGVPPPQVTLQCPWAQFSAGRDGRRILQVIVLGLRMSALAHARRSRVRRRYFSPESISLFVVFVAALAIKALVQNIEQWAHDLINVRIGPHRFNPCLRNYQIPAISSTSLSAQPAPPIKNAQTVAACIKNRGSKYRWPTDAQRRPVRYIDIGRGSLWNPRLINENESSAFLNSRTDTFGSLFREPTSS